MISVEARSEMGWSNDYHGLVLDILMQDEEVRAIGQFTARQKRLLDRAVKNGDLAMDPAAGPYPKAKRCYAAPKYDFRGARKRHIAELRRLAALDAEVRLRGRSAERVSGLRS